MCKMEPERDFDGLAQDCGNSTANALELPQSYAKKLICNPIWWFWIIHSNFCGLQEL